MPHYRPRTGAKRSVPHTVLTIAILALILGLGAWALHGGAVTVNAASLFGA